MSGSRKHPVLHAAYDLWLHYPLPVTTAGNLSSVRAACSLGPRYPGGGGDRDHQELAHEGQSQTDLLFSPQLPKRRGLNRSGARRGKVDSLVPVPTCARSNRNSRVLSHLWRSADAHLVARPFGMVAFEPLVTISCRPLCRASFSLATLMPRQPTIEKRGGRGDIGLNALVAFEAVVVGARPQPVSSCG